MKVLELLDEFESKLEISSSIPFSGKILIDRGEIFNLLKEIQLLLPDEIKHAKWIRDDRNNIIDEAKREAELIISEAKNKEQEILIDAQQQSNELLDKHKLLVIAKERAENIVGKAKLEAKDIRQNSFEYSLELINKVHNNMDDITQLLEKNRQELNSYLESEDENI